jgi:glycosyltransferase involved in cell wall biosynthesis
MCLVAKKLGLAFQNTLLVLALHSPSQWVLELNQTLPTSFILSAFNYAERLSVKCADVVWSPSKYLIDWALENGFELPEKTFVQQYCLPSQRLNESGAIPKSFPTVQRRRAAPTKEIVFFGRLEERKGLRLFCNAIHHLSDELAAGNITVTFLGKEGECGGTGSVRYIAERSRTWQFPIKTVTNLGQPEALGYLSAGDKLAVMASPVDNSPCTVYESLAWGIPFLAGRSGGVPELVHEADQDRVLFDCTTAALRKALLNVLDAGGWVAAPSQSQQEIRDVWSSFHANWKEHLVPPRSESNERRVVAIIDGRSQTDLQVTLDSLANANGVHHVIVLNREGVSLHPSTGKFSLRNIDLSIEDSDVFDEEIARLSDETVLMIHSGTRLRADSFAGMLSALDRVGIDGFQPAAEVAGEGTPRTVAPLGGDPSFTLFAGATFTGGLVVSTEALKRARSGRRFAIESDFMGLADFCVTRGIEIWPYPEPVFERPEDWSRHYPEWNPARVMAFDDCSSVDRYYMLATGYGSGKDKGASPQKRMLVMNLVNVGLVRVVRYAMRIRRARRSIRSRFSLGHIERRLERLLRWNT